MTTLLALAQANTVLLWDQTNHRLIAANIVGTCWKPRKTEFAESARQLSGLDVNGREGVQRRPPEDGSALYVLS